MTRLATCSYREYRPEMGVPVRISLGRPRWWTTPIPDSASIPELTPRGSYLNAPEPDFLEAYDAQLSRYGTGHLQARFAAIAGVHGEPLVLLCFENLATGDLCHRRQFAAWWYAETGQEVPEMGAQPPSWAPPGREGSR